MLERICRALCNANEIDPDGKPDTSVSMNIGVEKRPNWMRFERHAKMILTEMRAPTAKMVSAGNDQIGDYYSDAVWQSMIDAELKEKP